MIESTSLHKEKLRWRSRRSMLELDLRFAQFIKMGGLDNLDDIELKSYSELLELDDGDLLLLLQGRECCIKLDLYQLSLINLIRSA